MTNMVNASGKSNTVSMWATINSAVTALAAQVPIMIHRAPPLALSMAGPMRGATIENGARVSSRYSTTRQRAAS